MRGQYTIEDYLKGAKEIKITPPYLISKEVNNLHLVVLVMGVCVETNTPIIVTYIK